MCYKWNTFIEMQDSVLTIASECTVSDSSQIVRVMCIGVQLTYMLMGHQVWVSVPDVPC